MAEGGGEPGGPMGQGHVREETREMFHGMFEAAIKAMQDRGPGGEQAPPRVGLEQFLKMKPIAYDGETDVTKAERWIEAMENFFDVLQCPMGIELGLRHTSVPGPRNIGGGR